MASTTESTAQLPPCRLLFRSKEGMEIFTIPSERKEESTIVSPPLDKPRQFVLKGSTSFQSIMPDGSAVFVHRPDKGIVKIDLTTSQTQTQQYEDPSPFFDQPTSRVQIMDLSPKGTFLLTWERAQSGDGNVEPPPNLKVWDTASGKFIIGFRQKGLSRDSWPYVQWTKDETFAFLLATNEIRVYPGQFPQQSTTRFVDKLRIPGITSMSFPSSSPSNPSGGRILFTSFIPKDKNKPSRAAMYEYPSKAAAAAGANPYPCLLSKSLFQAEEMKVYWSPKGDAALIALQSTVDTSGQSYYGSTLLFLMSPTNNDTIAVPLPQEGPVLDVAWMPNGEKSPSSFAVIAGRMPAMASLHNGQDGKPTFMFGNRHQNTIIWAPHGRFVTLAGFGNLAGTMTFWDKNKLKQIPPSQTVTASCTVGYGWSPDSRLLCVSTTSPRMNVDNGVNVYRYNGDKLQTLPWNNQHYVPDRLLQATFLPAASTNVYPDRPQSPSLKDLGSGPDAAGAAATSTSASTSTPSAPPKPAGRYVPPSQRNRVGGTSLADRMRAEKEGKMMGAQKLADKPAKVVGATGKVVVGMSAPAGSTQKSKSAQRRERQKKQKEEEAARKELEEKLLADQKAKEAEAAAADPEKRARKIKKTLKQIDELKQKDAATLNDDQKKKIATEEELRTELAKLGL